MSAREQGPDAPIVSRPSTRTILWVAGMLLVLVGVAIRIAGNRPVGGGILLLGVLVLFIVARLGGLRRP
jgi:hypothetical protein